MDKGQRTLLILVSLILAVFFASVFSMNGFSSVGNVITESAIGSNKPLLIVSNVYLSEEKGSDGCFLTLKGNLSNVGDVDAFGSVVSCSPVFYSSFSDDLNLVKIVVGTVYFGGETSFSERIDLDCKDSVRFDCFAECENC